MNTVAAAALLMGFNSGPQIPTVPGLLGLSEVCSDRMDLTIRSGRIGYTCPSDPSLAPSHPIRPLGSDRIARIGSIRSEPYHRRKITVCQGATVEALLKGFLANTLFPKT